MTEPPEPPGPLPRKSAWGLSLLVGVLLAAVYLSNRREINSYDTDGSAMLALALALGDGPVLDRFRIVLVEPGTFRRIVYASDHHGHTFSRYPIAAPLLAVPCFWAGMPYLDWAYPGWRRLPSSAGGGARKLGKLSAVILVALAGVVSFRWLRTLGDSWAALAAVVAAYLGSDLWAVASQALWQHGPAALMLTLAMLLLSRPEPSRLRFLLAGFAAGLVVAIRLMDAVLIAPLVVWVAVHHPRRFADFAPGLVVLGLAVVGYNQFVFGTILGGQGELEAMHTQLHGVAGPWSGNPLEGALGTLLSPSRGLFVFCPWIALALLNAPWSLRDLPRSSVGAWMLWGLLPYFLMLSAYSVWWGGHCFGPRYWTDAIPLFALLLASGLSWSRRHARGLLGLYALTIAWSIGVQAIGAYLYPSSWNLSPQNVDTHHERLWDWRDSELTRCLREAIDGRSP